MSKDSEQYIDQLPPSEELVSLYKTKLKKCQKELLDLRESYENLRREICESVIVHSELQDTENKLHTLNSVLGQTQALLLVERTNSQQMALHIDLLKKQHRIDKEKLDLLLSLNGKPLPPSALNEETMLRQQLAHMDQILKEQRSCLLEERSLMKAEWERDQQKNEKIRKALKEKAYNLQEIFVQFSQHKIDLNIQEITDTLLGRHKSNFQSIDQNFECNFKADEVQSYSHCSAQEFKKLQRKVKELSEDKDSFQKKVLSQANLVHEINDKVKAQQEKYQAQLKAMREQVEKLREENDQLNKRRLNEGAGFRSEIRLLREQLQRTQRQLCFLSVKKYDV